MAYSEFCPMCGKRCSVRYQKRFGRFCSPECSDAWKEHYKDNPFVRIEGDNLCFTPYFLFAAQPLYSLGIDKVFEIFEIDRQYISQYNIDKMWALFSEERPYTYSYDKKESELRNNNTAIRILLKRMIAMENAVEEQLQRIGDSKNQLKPYHKKALCTSLARLPKDPCHHFTLQYICRSIGITSNSYWKYVHRDDYGLSIEARDKQCVELVRKAFEYKGYPKGVRMVYMLIPRISDQKIGLDRVRRIMRQYGMDCGLRKPSPRKAEKRESLGERTKPNLLRRMFRLHRPNEVRLTDVTYIHCNDDFKAYGSALMDPVTGVLVAFVISEYNDMELAMETLRQADTHPCEYGGVFHSDQGSLYLSPKFQAEVERLGFSQSMSRKGNCWDNSPQESFFGHFKDDCAAKYRLCKNIDELKSVIEEYKYYYNNERGLWDRQRMTPLEYEAYLLSLSDEDFQAYIDREMAKYIEMQESSKKKAIERARRLKKDEEI